MTETLNLQKAANYRSSRLLTALLALFLLGGCVTTSPPMVDSSWVTVGETQREEVLRRFGEPARFYENGLILAYRIVRTGKRGQQLSTKPLGEVSENLIFIFDGNGVLKHFRRVKLK